VCLSFSFFSSLEQVARAKMPFVSFLLKRRHGKWFLRGIKKLVELKSGISAFNDVTPNLHWIAQSAKNMYVLPKVPPSEKTSGIL